jgi:hypothetical protein
MAAMIATARSSAPFRRLTHASLFLACLTAAGCANLDPARFIESGIRLAPREWKMVKRAITARTCATYFLGMGSGDLSYAATMKELIKEVPPDAAADYHLVNLLHDQAFDFYFLAWKRCTVLTADVVQLLDRPAATAPSPAPVATGTPGAPAAAAPAEPAVGTPRGPCATAQACDVLCQRGHSPSCTGAGVFYLEGRGVPKNDTRALTLFKRACDDSDPPACRHLGDMYRNGQWVPKDPAQAARQYQRSCDLGDGTGCRLLAAMMEAGEGVPKDVKKARQLKARACKAGDQEACAR